MNTRPRARSGTRAGVGALMLVGALVIAAPARAVNLCTVAAQTHAFGAYDTVNPTAGTSSVTVTCTHDPGGPVDIGFTVALSSGPGSFAARQMAGGGDILVYNLYTTVLHSTVWGDGTSGTALVGGSISLPGGSGKFASQILTVYGLIGAPQNVTPAAYSTLTPITVTVTY